jgi:hypothetical protein
MPSRQNRRQREPDDTVAGDPAAMPATKTFSYAIQAPGGIRPVLTVSGPEDHRDTWIARAIAIAEQTAAADEQPMVWEMELGPAGTSIESYVLIYPEVNGIGA